MGKNRVPNSIAEHVPDTNWLREMLRRRINLITQDQTTSAEERIVVSESTFFEVGDAKWSINYRPIYNSTKVTAYVTTITQEERNAGSSDWMQTVRGVLMEFNHTNVTIDGNRVAGTHRLKHPFAATDA